MLKIKDNVDLKELEKFGFKKKYDEDTGKIIYYYFILKTDRYNYAPFIISRQEKVIKHKPFDFFIRKKRQICFPDDYYVIDIKDYSTLICDKAVDMLYDLIKADLVEKVEE